MDYETDTRVSLLGRSLGSQSGSPKIKTKIVKGPKIQTSRDCSWIYITLIIQEQLPTNFTLYIIQYIIYVVYIICIVYNIVLYHYIIYCTILYIQYILHIT